MLFCFQVIVTETNEKVKDQNGSQGGQWERFISRQTYHALLWSILRFLDLVSYIEINHSDTVIAPRTTNQDDAENYFSLKRSRLLVAKNSLCFTTWKSIQKVNLIKVL